MQKNKKDHFGQKISQKHSRNPSGQRQRDSHQRLTICCSPPHTRKSKHFLTNPTSLQKPKPKGTKKLNKNKKQPQQQATRETIETIGQDFWKDNLKLTFRSKKNVQKEKTLRNNSLKCMQQMSPIDSYNSLINTFPRKDQSASLFLATKQRIYLIDWLGFIAAELLLRKNTLHLAVAFVDSIISQQKTIPQKIQALGAGALLLAVKQEERGSEGQILNSLCSKESGITKDEIIQVESNIVLGLSFKLNFSTLPFWFDYFSQKWDNYIKNRSNKDNHSIKNIDIAFIRSPDGNCYQNYRQSMQLIDALLMHSQYTKYDLPKLSLAVLYLIVRIHTQSKIIEKDISEQFRLFFEGFKKKASPIFRDRYCFNEIFNQFIVQICDFEITQIIGSIKQVGLLLDLGFTYEIDSRIYQSSLTYEQFLRFTTYSQHIRDYFLARI